jgi:hypothetical protein
VRTVSYADEHFLTSDRLASAVLKYSQALALKNTSDVVRIPVLVDDVVTYAELILGPASQITTLELPRDDVDLSDDEALRDLSARMERLRSPNQVHPEPVTRDSGNSSFSDLDMGLD